MKEECKNCLHLEVCAYALPDLQICDSFLSRDIFDKHSHSSNVYAERFIIFTNEELDKIKAGELVACKDCDFSDHDEPYDIFCVSEDWYAQYTSEENLP